MTLRQTDYMQQLADYIKKNLSKGYTLDSLKFALQDQGYSRVSIDRAVQLANEQLAKLAPKMIEKPVIKVERIPISEQEEKLKISWWRRLFG